MKQHLACLQESEVANDQKKQLGFLKLLLELQKASV